MTTAQLSLIPQDMAALRGLLGALSDPVLLLDRRLHVRELNPAAQQCLNLSVGHGLDTLRTLQGGSLLEWLSQASAALSTKRPPPAAPLMLLPDGRKGALTLLRLQAAQMDDARWLLQVRVDAPLPSTTELPAARGQALLKDLWHSPFPASLQDSSFRLVAVNDAFLDFTGRSREQLLGSDPLHMHPDGDRADILQVRQRLRAGADLDAPGWVERRLLDGQGRERWYRADLHRVLDQPDSPHYLCVLQDCTAEHAAREQAERAAQELEQWFELSPMGMVLFDEAGLLMRSNTPFAALSLELPATLHEASPALQQLLGWQDGKPRADLQPGARQVEAQQTLLDPHGRTRWLRSFVRCHAVRSGQRRYLAVIEDRGLEEERDLAHQQLDALMDTAGVGLATFQQDAGWVRPRRGKAGAAPAGLAGLQGVGRDIVEPASLPEFERLQQALKKGDKTEVRYAVRHPELGLRWLLTRIEPGRLASGQRTTSVVTLDVTVQQQAQARNAQLLHELTTIIDSTSVGIAYLRGHRLVRCNQRFEQMLGLAAHTPAGTQVEQLFATQAELLPQIDSALHTLEGGATFEAEFTQEVNGIGHVETAQRWLSLSLRRVLSAGSVVHEQDEAIAVVTDITRLKAHQAELQALAHDREMMFSLTDVGVAILRQDRIERANGALAQLSGYRINELIGLEHAQLFESSEDYQHQRLNVDNALRLSGRWSGERRMRRQDGSSFWVQVSKRLVHEGDPYGGVIASFVSVDERWRAQQSLLLQTERTRAILDSVLVGIVTVGRGGIEWMNRSARRMFGGDLAEFVGHPMSIVATPEPDHPLRQTHYLDELTEGQAETFECRLRGRDGREFWVVGNAVVTGLEASGRQLTYALLDIERRRQAEALTAQAQASLQRIIETAPLAISVHDAKTLRVERLNQVTAGLAGRPVEDVLGLTPEQMFGEGPGPQIAADMHAALHVAEVTQREYRLNVNGKPRIWDARYLPLTDVIDTSNPAGAGGQPDQLLLVASDVTEQRAAEEARLQAAISQRELLVKEVHHRIKNNLQGVAGLLQQIAQRRPEVKTVINEAVGQVQAIAQVYGLQVGTSGPLRLRNVVEAITQSVQRMFGRSIQFSVEGDTAQRWALPEAESIPIALSLNELLTNAIKHSSLGQAGVSADGGQVLCRLLCDSDRVQVHIINTAHLPEGFDLSKVRGGVSGLGLVRALLPRRSATFSMTQLDTTVVCQVQLTPPGVTLLDSPAP